MWWPAGDGAGGGAPRAAGADVPGAGARELRAVRRRGRPSGARADGRESAARRDPQGGWLAGVQRLLAKGIAVGEPEIAQELACCVAWRLDLPESTQVGLIERTQPMYLRAEGLKEKLGKRSGQKGAVGERGGRAPGAGGGPL